MSANAYVSGPIENFISVSATSDRRMSEPECLQCRLIGGSALTATGAYAIWSSRPKAIGSPVGKRLVGLVGGGVSPMKTLNFFH
jgi:hypothetical protein